MTVKDWFTLWPKNPLKNHPMAHLLGGMGLDIVVRLPLFAPFVTEQVVGRLLMVALMQGAWEFWQLKETEGYPWWSAALDVTFAVAGAGLVEALFH
jgi:hypothetical protein